MLISAMGESMNRQIFNLWRIVPLMTRRLVVGLAAVALVVGIGGSPASAHPLPAAWRNIGHEICTGTGCISVGNAVALWQSILWANGKLSNVGQIDSQFGPMTRAATIDWQNDVRYDWNGVRLLADGRAGPRSWFAAQTFCNDRLVGDYVVYDYCDPWGTPKFQLREHRTSHIWSFAHPRLGGWWVADPHRDDR
jgi:hypothetical protein